MHRSEALNLRSLANAVISAPLLSFTSQTPTSFAFSSFATGKFYSFSFSRRNVRSITCETSNFYRKIPPTFLFYIHACNYSTPYWLAVGELQLAHNISMFYVRAGRLFCCMLRDRCVMCTSTGLSMLVVSPFLRDTLSQRYSLHGLQQVGTTGFRGRMCRTKYTWRIRVYHKNTVI